MSSEQTDFFNGRYYTVTKRCMCVIGQWPYQSTIAKCICFTTVLLFVQTILIPQGRKMILVWPDVDEALDCIPPMIISLVSTSKLLGSACNNRKIRDCLERIVEDWQSLRTSDEINILRAHAEHGRILSVAYLVYLLLTGTLYCLQPYMISVLTGSSNNSAESRIPLRVDYGVDMDKYFYPICVHVNGVVFAHIASWLATDILLVTLVQHACGMFSIVGHTLETIGNGTDLKYHFRIDKNNDKNYFTILYCFRRHLKAIEFVKLIESSFSMSFFFVAGFSMAAMSATGVQAVMHSTTPHGIIKYGALCLAQMLQVLYQCWQAQELINHSTDMYGCITRGHWYATSLRCRKLLRLMLTGQNIPCQLTAGKIYILSIQSFSTVMRTSLSYFTVLRSTQYRHEE